VPVRDSKTHRGKAKKKNERPFNLTYWREAKRKVKKENRERKEERRNRAELNFFFFLLVISNIFLLYVLLRCIM